MQLHPVKDGLIPEPHERGLTVRDRGGNKLVDVVSPDTGFCTGVRSPLTTSGKSVVPASPISGGKGPDIRYDSESARYYDLVRSSASDPVGLVIRLEGDSNGPLPKARVRVVEMTAPSLSAPVQKKQSVRKQNDEAVKAILTAIGYTGPITRQMRKAALDMLEIEKSVSHIAASDDRLAESLRNMLTAPPETS